MFELDVSRYLAARSLSDDAFRDELEARGPFWNHRFYFSNGVAPPGRDPSAAKLRALALPERLDGMSVIDIGACEGYYSFQCEARGASRVVAADAYLWTAPGIQILPNFRYIRDVVSSQVEERLVSVEDLSREGLGTFDIALFLGVLYHAPNMMQYLERLRAVTHGVAIVETLVDRLDVDGPSAAFYPPNTVNDDSSNWWGPNLPCVEGMLLRAGFARTEFVGLWETNTLDRHRGETTSARLRSGRAVWHAFV
jgi:tRNA (mo5U34)-methyltransferase